MGFTEQLEKSEVLAPSYDDDHDTFAHYAHKREIERALFEGVPATALCGKRFMANRDPKRYPVCPTCKDILDTVFPEA